MLVQAIKNLAPNATWGLNGDSYDGLEWYASNTEQKPTEEQVLAEVARLQAEYEANEYQRQRAAEYPSFADQFDLLYHGGYDAWKASIDVIKAKYPKE